MNLIAIVQSLEPGLNFTSHQRLFSFRPILFCVLSAKSSVIPPILSAASTQPMYLGSRTFIVSQHSSHYPFPANPSPHHPTPPIPSRRHSLSRGRRVSGDGARQADRGAGLDAALPGHGHARLGEHVQRERLGGRAERVLGAALQLVGAARPHRLQQQLPGGRELEAAERDGGCQTNLRLVGGREDELMTIV